ncbi:MAG: NADPH:quinone reductase [Geoglossum umbratile]|nr:MAG: NADPH:quinone reductase [Geoglossum umbratile]
MAATHDVRRTMKGVEVSKTGGVEVLEYKTDLPVPTPKEGEVLVKNDFVGINYIDIYIRSGFFPSPKPEILGREAEGHIVDVGPQCPPQLRVGDRVAYMANGTYAEYTATPVARTALVPESLPPSYGAAALLQGITALTLIRESYPVQPGDWILVHAAAGGVGLWLCQHLRAIGAKTIGTASTTSKMELARANGADYMINYTNEDVVAKVNEITGGEGVKVVYDGVGKATFDSDLECLAPKGSLISIGSASGPVPPVPILRLSAKNLRLMRPTVYGYIVTAEEFKYYAEELFRFMVEEKFNVQVHDVYPLQDAARAHVDLEGRKTTGKLLLKP